MSRLLFFERIKEQMKLEPFEFKSTETKEHGWEGLVYEHQEKKDLFLHIIGRGREFCCLMKKQTKLEHRVEMLVIWTYDDFLIYLTKC